MSRLVLTTRMTVTTGNFCHGQCFRTLAPSAMLIAADTYAYWRFPDLLSQKRTRREVAEGLGPQGTSDRTDNGKNVRLRADCHAMGIFHCTARRNHILDEGYAAAENVLSLDCLAGSISLCLLANEGRGKAGLQRDRRHKRDASQFEAGNNLGFGWDEIGHGACKRFSSEGMPSKQYLSKYRLEIWQFEFAFQRRHLGDAPGEIVFRSNYSICHRSASFFARLTAYTLESWGRKPHDVFGGAPGSGNE